MIIFDLDGVLADCSHRRHFVDPSKNPDYHYVDHFVGENGNFPKWKNKLTGQVFKPDYKSFYEACEYDKPIEPVIEIYSSLHESDMGLIPEIQFWSGRCESVRRQTISWFVNHGIYIGNHILKMRPIGDNTPDDQLKERWLDEYLNLPSMDTVSGYINKIEFVFDSDPKSISMYRRRGVFVFNCCQHDGEF